MRWWIRGVALAVLVLRNAAFSWSGHDVVEQGLKLHVSEVPPVEDPTTPQPVSITVSNGRAVAWRGELCVEGLVDDWRCEGPDRFPLELAAGGSTTVMARMVSGPFVFDALYPVHVRLRPSGSPTVEVHAVRIFEVRRRSPPSAPSNGAPPAPLRLRPDRVLSLRASRAHRFGWAYDTGPEQVVPTPGWVGSDPTSRASVSLSRVPPADPRDAIGMHVPWNGGAGSAWVEWTVELPRVGPVELRTATVIHHSGESERGRSDGVTGRVLVFEVSGTGEPPSPVYEELCEHRQWRDIVVDLTAWTGRTVRLRLEFDPGPKRNTSFDQAWWADPVLVAGTARALLPSRGGVRPQRADTAVLRELAQRVADGEARPDGAQTFALGDGSAAALRLGRAGLLDGTLALAARGGGSAALAGIEVDVEGRPAGRYPGTVLCLGVETDRLPGGALRLLHRMADDHGEFPLTVTLRPQVGTLRLAVECPRAVTRLRPGAWDATPARVYWGHGYVVERPGANVWYAGGHSLASSHVGIEFDDGPAVLEAFDVPPRLFAVDPASGIASLEAQMAGTLSLMCGRRAMDLAIGWRRADPRQAAAAVPRLAGRFVFDIWDGRFEQIETNLARMVRYGLTNSVLIIHNWQRWGYDYRLPDIWPPNPRVGTPEDLRRIERLARASDVLWGLHDNYIDFYPDAEGYSYRRIYFTADGRPHRAWYNESRDALSYKWRPDAILPFVSRNVDLIRAHVRPTCSFVDVFAAQPCGEWYDHEGRRHTPAEMRRHWGEAFAYLRDAFGGAPTTSEAGHDHLIGWLDGADCQWLRLTDEPRPIFSIRARCERWARVPWMDAAHHDRFILYGAGYSSRFAAGRGRWHGINSDEYLAAEILGGHPPMTDATSWGPAAVRKYWLMAEVARSLAMRRIVAHEFADGRIHRQTVRWDHGAVVHVNLDEEDWTIAGHILPPRGWYAMTPAATAAVERSGGHIVEWSASPLTRYLSARTSFHEPSPRPARVRPSMANARIEQGRLHYELVWTCRQSPGRNLTVLVHLVPESPDAPASSILAQDDHAPPRPTETWSGELRYERAMPLPVGRSGRFRLLVGLYNHWGRRALEGPDDGESRIWIATLDLTPGPTGRATGIVSEPSATGSSAPAGLNPKGTMVDLGWAATDGAFRLELDGRGGGRIVPLPEASPFRIRLRPSKFPGLSAEITAIEPEPAATGLVPPRVAVCRENGELALDHDPAVHAYLLRAASRPAP